MQWGLYRVHGSKIRDAVSLKKSLYRSNMIDWFNYGNDVMSDAEIGVKLYISYGVSTIKK